jgi:hypothetical protein
MSKYVYYLISDIHLEKQNEYKKQFLLEHINNVIEKNSKEDKNTIIIFSGDIDNGIKAYQWLKNINTQVVYVPGNHEFWENNFYDTVENLKKEQPQNVTFLYNDFEDIGDFIFVGGTMWTDVGKHLNDSLKYVSNGIMYDNYKIKAEQWYTENNIQKLKAIIPNHFIEKILEEKKWNIILEQEENEKTMKFFNEFSRIKSYLKKFYEEIATSDERLNKKYFALTKENYDKLHELKNLTNFTYKEWLFICKEFNFLGHNAISKEMVESITESEEKIFTKLSRMNVTKNLIVVSHHLPFLEERLVGYYSHYLDITDERKLWNEKADSNIFNIRNGLEDYPLQNYFYRINKGEFERDDSIVEAIHYNNNGAINIPSLFLDDVKVWCHGHDHQLNYQDYVKSISIITNPLSDSLDVFRFSENGVTLNEHYKQYHKINTREEQSKIEQLKSVVLKEVKINELTNEDELTKWWVFKLMNLKKFSNLLTSFSQNNKKLFTYLVKNQQFKIGDITDKQFQKLQTLNNANYFYFNEIKIELEKLDLAYAVRNDKTFSYSNRFNRLFSKEISAYFLGDSSRTIELFTIEKNSLEDFRYSHVISELFRNIYFLNKSIKKIKYLEKQLENFTKIESITDLFNQKLPNIYPKENKVNSLEQKLHSKMYSILDKYKNHANHES